MSTVKTVLLPISGEDFGVPSNVVGTDTNFGKNCYVYEGEVRQRPGHEQNAGCCCPITLSRTAVIYFFLMALL